MSGWLSDGTYSTPGSLRSECGRAAVKGQDGCSVSSSNATTMIKDGAVGLQKDNTLGHSKGLGQGMERRGAASGKESHLLSTHVRLSMTNVETSKCTLYAVAHKHKQSHCYLQATISHPTQKLKHTHTYTLEVLEGRRKGVCRIESYMCQNEKGRGGRCVLCSSSV